MVQSHVAAAPAAPHPLDPLSSGEIRRAAHAARSAPALAKAEPRFVSISLLEPAKPRLLAFLDDGALPPPRVAEVTLIVPSTGLAYVLLVTLGDEGGSDAATEVTELPPGTQPCFTPDDCFLAEDIAKADPRVQSLAKEHFGITDLALLACDPWSVHVAKPDEYEPLRWREREHEGKNGAKGGNGAAANGEASNALPPPRLVQTWLYKRDDADDNHYAHPLPLLPVVDLNARKVVALTGADDTSALARKIPAKSVNYHRSKLASNDYLEQTFRQQPAPIDITQPEGPSFSVSGRGAVAWQKWTFRVGFNYREGLVLHDVRFDGRRVLDRAAMVEMTVPYAEPHAPYESKNAGDVSDYGLGFCATPLRLCADCKGDITYFDAVLSDSAGEPYTLEHAVCMHEEDAGVAWKHVEYRTGHQETRRARVLVLQSSYTVVNYEYLSYITIGQDGAIAFDVKLTGELSTNLLPAEDEAANATAYGTVVAPGVNAQFHQHMFCYRLDMAVDGGPNRVIEQTVERVPFDAKTNPYGNAFRAVATPLATEATARRPVPAPGTTWRIENAAGKCNKANGRPTAYKLVPNARGSAQPLLLADESSAVFKRGEWASAALWVTPYEPVQRYPAGDYPTQSLVTRPLDGLPKWTESDRNVDGADVVLWHTFGATHVPRVEDFPVMPVEVVGFVLKPDGFFDGNPLVDVPPAACGASTQRVVKLAE